MNQRGGVSIGCLLTTAILLAGAYHAYVFGLPYYYNSNLEQRLYEVAEVIFHQGDEEIKRAVIEAAAENKVVLKPEQIAIEQTSSSITMRVNYTVQVATPLIQRTIAFDPVVTRNFSR
jgi:hypothetical protein